MFLFEGYFGTVLATGDFRYYPSMLDAFNIPDIQVDICYLDNTYFNPLFSQVPDRHDALRQIIGIIEKYRSENVLFKILLKTLGKENLLVDLANYFRVPIVLSFKRYERLTKILQIDKNYFTYNFTQTSFIFVDDEPGNRFGDFLKDKKIIYIEPTALKFSNSESTCDTNFFRVPYTDHSSYLEIIYFVKEVRPKKIIPIVRKMLPNQIDTTDLTDLEKFLNKAPIKDSSQKYSLLLQSKTSTRKSSKLNSISLNQSKTRVATPITTRFVTLRKKCTKELRKKIEYESPSKQTPKRLVHLPNTISLSSQNRCTGFLKKNSHPSRMVTNFLDPILEESRIESDCQIDSDYDNLSLNEGPAKNEQSNKKGSSDKENENFSNKWKKINDNLELLVLSDSDDSVYEEEKRSELVKISDPKVMSKKFNPVVILERIDDSKFRKVKENWTTEQEKEVISSDESIYIENTIEDDFYNKSINTDSDILNDSIDQNINENIPKLVDSKNESFFDFMNEKLKDYVIDPVEIGEQIRIHILDSFVF
ncbi:5 exonuclease Apollo [Brachionus plicatilis]|uniref:Protein artemis n=1 Tax=Brachionus plicatilis TaxID=10195 RepID=A0A3M7S634_BRAPC|nr:5 exonuclease Apollo [Brachionus plicatilis]